jgi:hypothetical protein
MALKVKSVLLMAGYVSGSSLGMCGGGPYSPRLGARLGQPSTSMHDFTGTGISWQIHMFRGGPPPPKLRFSPTFPSSPIFVSHRARTAPRTLSRRRAPCTLHSNQSLQRSGSSKQTKTKVRARARARAAVRAVTPPRPAPAGPKRRDHPPRDTPPIARLPKRTRQNLRLPTLMIMIPCLRLCCSRRWMLPRANGARGPVAARVTHPAGVSHYARRVGGKVTL